MSTEGTLTAAAPLGAAQQALRLAFGTAVGFTAANALGWPAALLSPILFIQLSAGLAGCPGFAVALRTTAVIAACVFIGWLMTSFVAFPFLCVLLIALVLFAAFWAQAGNRGGLAPFVLMIAICVLPVLAVQDAQLARLIAVELVRASGVAFLLVWATWALFPDPQTLSAADSQSAPTAFASSLAVLGDRDRARVALINTLVVLPVLLAFLLFELSSAVVALITMLAIIRAQTNTVRLGMTAGLLQGNLLAALTAALSAAVIYAAPSLLMLFGVVLLAGLLLSDKLTAGPAVRRPVWMTALVSTVALLDSALSALSEGAGTAAWSRIINVSAAILYVTVALQATAGLRLQSAGKKFNRSKVSPPPPA
jgi:Protein of unknown function (DUF2955)